MTVRFFGPNGAASLCALALLPACAVAQAAIEEVITHGSAPDVQWQRAGTVYQSPKTDVLTLTAHDALRDVPGVVVSSTSGQEYLLGLRSPVLTGPGSCGGISYVEMGVRIRPLGTCNVNNLFEVVLFDLEGLTVSPGPTGSLSGGGAINGTISSNPAPVDAPSVVSAAAGSHGLVSYGAASQLGTHRLSVSASVTDGFRDETASQDGGIRHLYRSQGPWVFESLISAKVLNQDSAGYLVGVNSYRTDARRQDNPNAGAYRDLHAIRWVGSVSKTTNDQQGLFRVGWTARRSRMEFLQHFLPGTPTENNGQDSLASYVEWTRSSERVHWNIRGEVEVADVSLKQIQEESLTTGSAFNQAVRPEGVHYDFGVATVNIGVVADAVFSVGEHTDLIATARIDTLSYDYRTFADAGNLKEDGTACGFGGCLYLRPNNRRDTFTLPGWRTGVRQTWTALSWHVAIARAERPPQTFELYRVQRGQSVNDIDSETSTQLEAGISGKGDATRWSVAVFSARTTDLIFTDGDGRRVSGAARRSRGLEVDLTWSITRSHQISIQASWSRHLHDRQIAVAEGVIDRGQEVDGSLGRSGTISWQYNITSTWNIGLGIEHVGPYAIDALATHSYDGHTIATLKASWHASSQWTAGIEMDNLTDRRYSTRADFSRFSGERHHPDEGRVFRAFLQFRY